MYMVKNDSSLSMQHNGQNRENRKKPGRETAKSISFLLKKQLALCKLTAIKFEKKQKQYKFYRSKTKFLR